MAPRRFTPSSKSTLPFKTGNREKRQKLHIIRKKALDNTRRDERFQRRREEDRDPSLREERLRQNVPLTLERKRVWDSVDADTGDGLGVSVDIERLKRQKLEEEKELDVEDHHSDKKGAIETPGSNEDRDSMIDSASDSASDSDETSIVPPKPLPRHKSSTERATSPTQSTTSTSLDLTPAALAARFPSLFSTARSPSVSPCQFSSASS